MNLKKHTLTGLFASAVSASQTSIGLASSSFGESSGCSGVLKDLVLIDSVLFECENKPVLTPSEILQCKEIVNCLIESGFVSQNTLPEGGVVPGATTEKCVQQPTKCSDEE